MNDQIIRLFEILKILNRYPNELTIPQIKSCLDDRRIEVSERTVQRDMNTLMAVFIGIDNKKHNDKSVGWFWSEDAPVMNLSGLTINQALSFSLIKRYLTPLFPSVTLNALGPFFDQAEATLEGLNENPLLEWPNKIAVVEPTQPLIPPIINTDIHKSVTEALLEDLQLNITYQPVGRNQQVYHLNPLGLFLRNQVSYLVASKVDTEDLRSFALHRMSKAEKVNKQAVHPKDFDFQKYITEQHILSNITGKKSFEPIQLKFVADNWVATHLSESRLSEDQKIERIDDESSIVTATVQETEQLFWWLLGFGVRVEVLEPIELRKKMADSVKVLNEKYDVKRT
jgi:predicted DNA-binding transcriptional regulator YafY